MVLHLGLLATYLVSSQLYHRAMYDGAIERVQLIAICKDEAEGIDIDKGVILFSFLKSFTE